MVVQKPLVTLIAMPTLVNQGMRAKDIETVFPHVVSRW